MQEPGAHFLLFFFGLLAKLVRLRRGLARFFGFGGQRLLLDESLGLRFLGLLPLARSFLGGLLRFGLGSLSLGARGFRLRTRPGLRFRVCLRFGL
ncbi:MAG: hypothetical protein ABR920_16880 [Terriglobales bacterium]